jgi:hypothetical protein
LRRPFLANDTPTCGERVSVHRFGLGKEECKAVLKQEMTGKRVTGCPPGNSNDSKLLKIGKK